jgi:CheY-like chemotaxis protein
MLPGEVDGIEVCRRLRADPAMQGIGVVMVSARTDAKTRQEAVKAGAAEYWAKPVSARDLADKVRAVLHIKEEFPPRPAAEPRLAPAGAWGAPAHDPVIDSIVKLLNELEPADRQEIKALLETRLALKRQGKTV